MSSTYSFGTTDSKMNIPSILTSLQIGQRVKFTYTNIDGPLHRLGASASCGIHSDFDEELELDRVFTSRDMTLLAFRNPQIPIENHFYEKYISVNGDVYYYLDMKHTNKIVDTITLL